MAQSIDDRPDSGYYANWKKEDDFKLPETVDDIAHAMYIIRRFFKWMQIPEDLEAKILDTWQEQGVFESWRTGRSTDGVRFIALNEEINEKRT